VAKYISNISLYISVYNCNIPQHFRLTNTFEKQLKLMVSPIRVAKVV